MEQRRGLSGCYGTMKRIYYIYFFIIIIIFIAIIYRAPFYVPKAELLRSKNVKFKYEYFIENTVFQPTRKLCSNNLITIIVTSYVGHVKVRSAHRKAMPQDVLHSMNISRIFLLAQIPTQERSISQKAVKEEHDTYGDILQGTFTENYRNLTHKHLMGLKWASTVCTYTSFILKTDDDIVFDLNKTYQLITNIKHLKDDYFLMGNILNNTEPKRLTTNKWYVTWNEYPRNKYPPYLSGWYYITTPKTAAKLCKEAILHPYFWIDDIFVTGLLIEGLHVKLLQIPNNYWLEYYELLECCLRDMITKNILCDYSVGPNGGRNDLILEFNEALSRCSSWQNCTKRPLSQPLNKICVSFRERPIFSKGRAEIEKASLGK